MKKYILLMLFSIQTLTLFNGEAQDISPSPSPVFTPLTILNTTFPHPTGNLSLLESLSFTEMAGLYQKLYFSLESTIEKSAADSGWSGNGGDFLMEGNNVWYLGDETVFFCIKKSENHPFSEEELSALVIESLNDWVTFFEKYGLHNQVLDTKFPKERLQIWDGKPRKMSLNFKKSNECPSDENGAKVGDKLYFLFEASNKIVESYKEFSTENALGVAIRKKFDHVTYRNGGFVWIADLGRDRERLKHMLLHELGHVFGMPHDSVFVMSEEVAAEVMHKKLLNSDYFGRIESGSWPYRLRDGDQLILTANKGRMQLPRRRNHSPCLKNDFSPNNTLPPRVQQHLGLRPRGCHQISLKVNSRQMVGGRATEVDLELVIVDSLGGRKLVLNGSANPFHLGKWDFNGGPSVFTKWINEGGGRMRAPLWRRGHFEIDPALFPARGQFLFGGKKLAVKITIEKGPVLEIYLPELENWWVLKGLHHEGLEDSSEPEG